jgi:hypothetical protein
LRLLVRGPSYPAVFALQQLSVSILGIVVDNRSIGYSNRFRQISQAAGVSTTDILIANVVAALQNALSDTKDSMLSGIETDIDEVYGEACGLRGSHYSQSSLACQSGLDGEADTPFQVPLDATQGFAPSCQGDPMRVEGVKATGDCIGVQKIFAALKVYRPIKRTLPRPIGPANDGQDWHRSDWVWRQFAKDRIVVFPRCARDQSNLEATAIGLFHYVEAGTVITIENRNTSYEGLVASAVPCSSRFTSKFVGEDVEFCHEMELAPLW